MYGVHPVLPDFLVPEILVTWAGVGEHLTIPAHGGGAMVYMTEGILGAYAGVLLRPDEA